MGLGTQSTLAQAQAFVTTHGTESFPMLWDPTFASWAALGITAQPASMLLTADGRVVDAWAGRIPEERVLDLVSRLG